MFKRNGLYGIRAFSKATVNIIIAGNSLCNGEGSSDFDLGIGNKLARQVGSLPCFVGTDIAYLNGVTSSCQGGRYIGLSSDGINGANNSMRSNITDVTSSYDPIKTNILLIDELTNQLSIDNSDTTVLNNLISYINLVRSGNGGTAQKWFIAILTGIPRGVAAVDNTSDLAYQRNIFMKSINTKLLSNPKSYGIDYVIDRITNFQSPRNISSFVQASMDSLDAYYSPVERSAATGGTGTFTATYTAGSASVTNIVVTGYPPHVGQSVTSSTVPNGLFITSISTNSLSLNTGTGVTAGTGIATSSVNGGKQNLHTHPSDAGYALQFPLLDQAFRQIALRI